MRTCVWLKKFRQEKSSLSIRALGKKIGEDSGNFCKYENGVLIPSDNFLGRFSNELRLSAAERELLSCLVAHDKLLRFTIKEDER